MAGTVRDGVSYLTEHDENGYGGGVEPKGVDGRGFVRARACIRVGVTPEVRLRVSGR